MDQVNTELINLLRETYQREGFTHVNLERYEPRFDSWGDPIRKLAPTQVALKDFTDEVVSSLIVGDFAVGINSKARLNYGRTAHMPQLEFDGSFGNLEEATYETQYILDLFPQGQIVQEVKSGNGYHFHGSRKMSFKNWRNFMRTARDGSSSVDKAFIARSLNAGYSTLRLTSNSIKPTVPSLSIEFDTSKQRVAFS